MATTCFRPWNLWLAVEVRNTAAQRWNLSCKNACWH